MSPGIAPAAVALVGAGPGDPDLLTLRAEELLGMAAVVVVDVDLTPLARSFAGTAVLIAVPFGRSAIDVLLAAAVGRSGPVVRLYRGDPWLHPAYQAERTALGRARISTESVAGVAVEVALPALFGVPVHMRQLAVACTIGPYQALPADRDAARTLVASGDDAQAMVRAVIAAGDGRLPCALVPVTHTATPWRGPLADALQPAATLHGTALLVVGAVCGADPRPEVASTAGTYAGRVQEHGRIPDGAHRSGATVAPPLSHAGPARSHRTGPFGPLPVDRAEGS